MLGPDLAHDGPHGGLEFRPPAGHRGPTLLVGDATAVPAALAVLERLPHDAHGEVVLEVPEPLDIADVRRPVGLRVTWVVGHDDRSDLPGAVGEAVARLGLRPAPDASAAGEPDVVPEDEVVWEVPDTATAGGLYAWIAGEAGLVTGLRRHLVRDLGVDRGSVAFMGYWRRGRSGV